MRLSKRYVAGLVTALVMGTVWAGCTTYPEHPPPLQTKILRVEKEPDPVATGDTATFTCVIEDSTDERFNFYWVFGHHTAPDTTTASNSIKWIAPDTSGVYDNVVEVFKGAKDSIPPNRPFNIEVVEK